MTTNLLIFIVVLVVVVALVFRFGRRRRTARLRDQFGPEYERTAGEPGSRHAAEPDLEERRNQLEELEELEELETAPLDAAARGRYLERWHLVQARFVDSPTEATRAADQLINEVMHNRGYPVEELEQRAADISVDHAQVVADYRAAHAVAEANERSEASTEDLRQALVHYRSLFEDLLDVPEADHNLAHDQVEAETPRPAEAPVAPGAANGRVERDSVPAAERARTATPASNRTERPEEEAR